MGYMDSKMEDAAIEYIIASFEQHMILQLIACEWKDVDNSCVWFSFEKFWLAT